MEASLLGRYGAVWHHTLKTNVATDIFASIEVKAGVTATHFDGASPQDPLTNFMGLLSLYVARGMAEILQ